MVLKKGSRVVFQSKFEKSNISIPSQTVATVLTTIDQSVVVRYDFDVFNDVQKIVGVPFELLRIATLDDLQSVDYKNLASQNYFIGEKLIVGSHIQSDEIKLGDVCIVQNYELAIHEQDDLITLDFSDSRSDLIPNQKYTLKYITSYFTPYDEEIEKQLGEQIDFKNVQKNYHLIGARMFLNGTNPEDVVIIKDKLDNDQFLVKLIDGKEETVRKEELFSISDLEIFHTRPTDFFTEKMFSVGKSFIASKNISKHAILNEFFFPGDVVTVVHIDSINVNSYDDLLVVERTGSEPVGISIREITTYFIPYLGMIKKGVTKKLTNEDSFFIDEILIEETEPVAYDLPPIEEVFAEEMLNLKDEVKTTSNDIVKIHKVSINEFTFEILSDGTVKSYSGNPNINDIDSYVKALIKLKELVEEA